MAGPYQQYSDPELSQPNYSEPYPSHPIPAAASVYPGMLPPPVPYPSRHRWRLIPAILLMVVILAGATTAVVYAVNAGSNSIAVIPLNGEHALHTIGLIPTAYDPTDIAFSPPSSGASRHLLRGEGLARKWSP